MVAARANRARTVTELVGSAAVLGLPAGAREPWRRNAGKYHPAFHLGMDSVTAATECATLRAG